MKLKIKQAVKCGYIVAETPCIVDCQYPTSKLRRGRVQGGGKICPTLPTSPNGIYVIRSIYDKDNGSDEG